MRHNDPGDLDDCSSLSYDEYIEMVDIIVKANKNAVE